MSIHAVFRGCIKMWGEVGGVAQNVLTPHFYCIFPLWAFFRPRTIRIEAVTGGAASGFLTRLEREYEFIAKVQPLFEGSAKKNIHYKIDDNFYRFWFRFIFKYNYLLEVKMHRELREIVERDYDVFSGIALEGYFRRKFVGEGRYSRIGGWWDRKGENEIDLVCENEFKQTLDFYEVKRDRARIDLNDLERKSKAFLDKNPEKRKLRRTLSGLSLEDM